MAMPFYSSFPIQNFDEHHLSGLTNLMPERIPFIINKNRHKSFPMKALYYPQTLIFGEGNNRGQL